MGRCSIVLHQKSEEENIDALQYMCRWTETKVGSLKMKMVIGVMGSCFLLFKNLQNGLTILCKICN